METGIASPLVKKGTVRFSGAIINYPISLYSLCALDLQAAWSEFRRSVLISLSGSVQCTLNRFLRAAQCP